MTLDDVEDVKHRFGNVKPVPAEHVQAAIDGHAGLRSEFEPGDELYHYSTLTFLTFLAGDFGYLRVRGREIVGSYLVGMS